MDKNTKIYFTLGIGFADANVEDEFTLEQLGYDSDKHKDLENFIEHEYKEWRAGYLDGGWRFEVKD